MGNYGHTKPLKDGAIASTMFALEHIEVSPVVSIFRRMVRGLEFDVAEMALSTYMCARSHGKPFTGIPVFLTRAFYHGGLVFNTRSGIASPKDLEGRRVGLRSYTLTPGVWTRGILQTEYGVDLEAVTWVLSGDEHVAEFVPPANVLSSPNNNLGEMLLSGEIDAAIGAGPVDSPDVQPLFAEPDDADAAWHRKTGIYPISHMVVVKDAQLEANPGLEGELFEVFKTAKAQYIEGLRSGDHPSQSDQDLLKMAEIVGEDPIPYGFESSRRTLETFIRFNAEQGVIPEKISPEELFPASTLALV
ncbi:MAG: ABC transporter substrate-binding protein [Chloroflexi bacterium]|nr:ABC transporter substrate-binding protein [Chloroflexota bacterium]